MVERVLQWVRERTSVVAVAGGAGVLVLVLVVGSLGGDSEPVIGPTTTTVGSVADIFGPDETDDDLAGVPALDCSLYLTIREASDALIRPSEPEDLPDVSLTSRGEVCNFTVPGEASFFVRLEPGEPADFEDGGTLLATSGELVADVGDEARWFGGPDAEGGGSAGVISVRQATPLGVLHFRVVVGHPDLESAEQLETARALALKALPRFPGMPLQAGGAVNLCELVSDAEAEEVLAEYREAHPATMDEVFVTSLFANEVDLREEGDAECTKLILAEIYMQLQQGSPADFEPGADFEGVRGESITVVGDEAVWFADVPYQDAFTFPHTQGILSVRLGQAAFRIVLAVPETPAADQLQIVAGLAAGAVARITGEEPAGDAVITDPDGGELEPGLVENLLAREQAGEWTLGEGLVATLGWFAGDFGASQVTASESSLFELGDDVFALAFDYLNANPDDASREEVEGLLRRLITSPGRLTATSAFEGQPAETAFRSIRVTSHDEGYRNTLDSSDYCWDVYGVEGGGCLREVEIPDLNPDYADRYTLGRPVSDFAGAWNESHYSAAAEAIAASANVLEDNGQMPEVVVLFTQQAQSTNHYDIGDEEFCEFHIGVKLQGDLKDLQQTLAYALALCLFHDEPDAWWRHNLSVYLSGVIFPEHNYEHLLSPTHATIELHSAVGIRGYPDWLFWEYLHRVNAGDRGNVRLARSTDSPFDLANHPDMDIWLRDFYRALTDANVPDLGFGVVPYEPKASVMQISGPLKPVNLKPEALGVKRLRLEVVGHDYACVVITAQGDAQLLWREGHEGGGGTWTNEPPSAISGESIIVVTTTSGSGFTTLQVKDVGDNEECKDDPDEPEPYNPPPTDDCGIGCPFSRFFRDTLANL